MEIFARFFFSVRVKEVPVVGVCANESSGIQVDGFHNVTCRE